jgi:peptidoglycan/xylan/chitin deacetylase (PgdA/CDA1 family)
MIMPPKIVVQWFWSIVTNTVGMRRLGTFLKKTIPAYQDTIFFFEPDDDDKNDDHDVGASLLTNCIALTIDDGVSRGGIATSMVPELIELFQRYNNAHATFFVCTDYSTNCEEHVQLLLQAGHELGNHLKKDVSGYYCTLSQNEFAEEFHQANDAIHDILQRTMTTTNTTTTTSTSRNDEDDSCSLMFEKNRFCHWFRPPQGLMTNAMRAVVAAQQAPQQMQTVLGDCYCDDWAFAEDLDEKGHEVDHSGSGNSRTTTIMQRHVVPLMMRQLEQQQPLGGSIAVFHMPERGFREGCFHALDEFLKECQTRNISCMTLSELQQLAMSTTTKTQG